MDAAGYRLKAKDLRERAKHASDPVIRHELLFLADQYEAPAKHADDVKKKSERA